MSLDLFLQEAKLNQTKPDLKVRNIYRDGKSIVKSCSILIDRIEFSVSYSFKFNVWICTALLKTRIFIWLAIQNRLCSRVFFYVADVFYPRTSTIDWYNANLHGNYEHNLFRGGVFLVCSNHTWWAAVAMVSDVKWKVWEENMEIILIWYYLQYLINQK